MLASHAGSHFRSSSFEDAQVGKSVGPILRAIREAKKISLRDLERKIGMPASQLRQVERGVRQDPSFGTIVRIARGLGVSLDELAGLRNTAPIRLNAPCRQPSWNLSA